VDATNLNTASKVVARDASGDFSAGTITAALSGNATSATTSSSTTGNAATATTLQTARTIGGVSFNGSANINLPGVNAAGNQSTTGNAATATTLQTARTINGVSFNGSANIAVEPYISNDDTGDTNCPIIFSANTTEGYKRLYEDSALYFNNTNNILYSTTFSGALSGNATTATTLQTARTIGGVSFNGSANIDLPGVNATGNQNTSGSSASCTGNAATATNVAYSGLTGTVPTWNQNTTGSSASCTGNAATATTAAGLTGNPNITTGTILGGNTQLSSLGINTAASGTAGEIRATNNITAYYSDDRLKTKLGDIDNALDKIDTLAGFYYEANQTAQDLGYTVIREVGVSAQSVQAIMPEVVAPAPIDDRYLTVRYERLVPLLIQGIKELRAEIKALKGE
jgi:hypothetical protein